ncbi:MAG: hemerythrin family protein [Magnetococcales bacterium]|nr:hemerythrin family protein [Magnetococcales bacterium]
MAVTGPQDHATFRRELDQRLRDVGVSRFNAAHKQLLDLIKAFHGIVEDLFHRKPTSSDWNEIDRIFTELIRYTQTHFRDEEKSMREHGYPQLDAHKAQHHKLEEQLKGYQQQLMGRDVRSTVDMKFFLLEWLFSHINNHDMRYKEFFNKKGVR